MGDRFILNRENINVDYSRYLLTKDDRKISTYAYSEALKNALFDSPSVSSDRVLPFHAPNNERLSVYDRPLRILFGANRFDTGTKRSNVRYIDDKAKFVLHAPDFVDDYYLNLMDWSSRDVLAVALGTQIHTRDSSTKSITKIFSTKYPDDLVTSVAWANRNIFSCRHNRTRCLRTEL